MKEKYVVLHIPSDMYLADDYYRPNSIKTTYLGDAHKFSAFELKLASKTILMNKKNYRVYKYNQLNDKEIILNVDRRKEKNYEK